MTITAFFLAALLSASTNVDECIELYLMGEMEECVSSLEVILSVDSLSLDDKLRAYHRLGTAYYGLENPSKTRDAFGEVLRLDPHFELGSWENPALHDILDDIRNTEMASIMLEGTPEYSLVFFDDKYIGTTPLQRDNLFIGDTYTFIVCAGGYDPKEITVTIQPDILQTVDFSLSLIPPIEIALEAPEEEITPLETEYLPEEDIQVAELDLSAPDIIETPIALELQHEQNNIPSENIQVILDDIAVEDGPAAQTIPTPDDTPAQEDIQVILDDVAVEDGPAVQTIPAPDDTPAQEDIQVILDDVAVEDGPAAQTIPAPDDTPTQEDIQVILDDVAVEDGSAAQTIPAPDDTPVQEIYETSANEETPEHSAISESMALLLGDNVTMTSLGNVNLQQQSSAETGIQNIQTERDYNQFRGTVTPIEIGGDSETAMTFSDITFETRDNTMEEDALFSSRTSEEIMQVLSSKVSTVTYIYNKHIRNDPLLSGTLLVEITVETSGRVSKVNILASSTYNPAFDLELADAIEKWRFGVVDENEDPLVIQYPFTFSR